MNKSRSVRLLVVDDEPSVVDLLVESLTDEGYLVTGTTSPAQALEDCAEDKYDLVIADVEMPAMRGPELMAAIHAKSPGQLVILMTAFGSVELAARTVREGACDFVTKPFGIETLTFSIERALRERQLQREIVRLRRRVERSVDGELVAESPPMRRVLDLATRVAPSSSTVLVTGENGVGKRTVAEWIHRRSGRAELVRLGCSAMPTLLLESELFDPDRGVLGRARGGTLLLEGIGELPLEIQAKLLQRLESRGSDAPLDLRLVGTSEPGLEAEVRAGRFRADLYHHFNVIRIEIPPLRERREDIPALIDRLLPSICERVRGTTLGLSAPAIRWLVSYDWPGNVRELSHILERAVALAEHDTIVLQDVRTDAVRYERAIETLDDAADRAATLAEVEAAYIRKIIERSDGNKARAARILGIDRRTLYRRFGSNDSTEE